MREKRWMWRALGLILCGLLVVALGIAEKNYSAGQAEPKLSKAVTQYLKEQKITKYDVKQVTFPDIVQKKVRIEVTDREIQEYIKEDLASYDHLQKIDKQVIDKGDFLRLEYGSERSLQDGQQTVLKVGKNLFDKTIEKDLVGKRVGKIYKMTAADGTAVYVRVAQIVKYVEQKLTKSFLQKNGYVSETDYRKKIKEQLIRQKEQSVEQEEYDKFIDRMRKNCKITLDEKETAAFALSNYVNNVQQTAILNKQDFAEYVKETYQMSKDDYYQSVYQQSEQDITKVILEGILSVSVGEDGREYAENVYAIKKHYLHIQYEEYI